MPTPDEAVEVPTGTCPNCDDLLYEEEEPRTCSICNVDKCEGCWEVDDNDYPGVCEDCTNDIMQGALAAAGW